MNRVNFNPDGFHDRHKPLHISNKYLEEMWKELVFRIEEIEGKVPFNKDMLKNLERQRTIGMYAHPYEFIDIVRYKSKPIIKFSVKLSGEFDKEIL